MKLAIIGYGRMGHMIESIARERGHEIVCIIDKDDLHLFESKEFRSADVAIEFTMPTSAVDNILRCFAAGVPVVCGTTGWLSSMPEIKTLCQEGKGTLMWGSNFSVGVNIFRSVNRHLARIMQQFPAYKPELEEVHHIHKLDHPSGTAVTLAEDLLAEYAALDGWYEPEEGATACDTKLPINHKRDGEVPGIHTITWESSADLISITHSAKNREGFALGAVLASEWLKGKTGYHDVAEMFNLD